MAFKRNLYFSFKPWMQLQLRFFRIKPLFSSEYKGIMLYYFPVQNCLTGQVYLIGFKESFMRRLAKLIEERNYTDQTITHYKITIWNKPFVSHITKKWYFSPVIRGVSRLAKKEYGKLEGIRRDIAAGRRKNKIVEPGDIFDDTTEDQDISGTQDDDWLNEI